MTRDVLAAMKEAAAQARAANKTRRLRVLAYEDLAQRLTQPPLRYPKADMWNGYVPPRTLPPDVCPDCPSSVCRSRDHPSRANTSSRRRALVEIATEAYRRETGQEDST